MLQVANDYYDFNPSPATWAVLLTGMVLFVLAISVVFIVMVDRGQAGGTAPAHPETPRDAIPETPVVGVLEHHAKAS